MSFSLQLEPSLADLATLRRELRVWLAQLDAGDDVTEDIVLACWEAAANALEHPVESSGEVRVDAQCRNGRVVISVADTGRWHLRKTPRPGRGLGLRLVNGLMDEVQVVPTRDGTRILMWRCVSQQGRAREERPNSVSST